MKKWTLLILVGLLVGTAVAQQQGGVLSAKNALSILGQKFGANRFQSIVEMRAFNGVPQPKEWNVVVYDPASIYLLTEYWIGDGRAVNEGPHDEIYPDKAPIGFINFAKLKLDSVAAFTVAEGEARRARVGFDSLNYILRAREYSDEPVWILALVDADKRLVGKVHLSGVTGSVLRTIWIDRQGPTPKVIDSAVPNGSNPGYGGAGGLTAPASNTNTVKPPLGGSLYPSTRPKQGSVRIPERRASSLVQ
ncbi:MAG: hypothetical protein L3J39_16150 [Verrucomicrobiales bacterium]|nr:hypothetical protein [Verrucomicrobiales bacterium]